jgi:hypothetical protein
LASILTAFELVCPAPGEVLSALIRTAAVCLPGLRSFAPGSPVVFLPRCLITVRGSFAVLRIVLPLVALTGLSALSLSLTLLLVFLTVNVVVDVGIPVVVNVHIAAVPV